MFRCSLKIFTGLFVEHINSDLFLMNSPFKAAFPLARVSGHCIGGVGAVRNEEEHSQCNLSIDAISLQ